MQSGHVRIIGEKQQDLLADSFFLPFDSRKATLLHMERNTAPRILLVTAISLFFWLVIGPVFSIVLQQAMQPMQTGIGMYVSLHIPYAMLFIALFSGVHLILSTDMRTFISGTSGAFRWKLSLKTGLIYLLFMAAAAPVASKGLHWSGIRLSDFLSSLIPVIILTPLQALSEEILFRVIPLRFIPQERMPRNAAEALPYTIISGLLFALPHLGNNEVTSSESALLPFICYMLWGCGAAFISVASGGFEAAIAMHVANNLFIALVMNYENSSMPVKAIFTGPMAGGIATLIETILVFTIVYFYLCIKRICRPGFMMRPVE